MADEDGGEKPKLGDILESYVALVMMSLDPSDVCKYAKLNRMYIYLLINGTKVNSLSIYIYLLFYERYTIF